MLVKINFVKQFDKRKKHLSGNYAQQTHQRCHHLILIITISSSIKMSGKPTNRKAVFQEETNVLSLEDGPNKD